MGVPKFFRYISERYPCLSQLILECEVPEFDNLYLDMNGIIHNCSHPNDYDPHFRITEEKIFMSIMHYIEALFRIIKPKKLFFMAVDGVAPRAKMNQQRGRRFRSAKEAEDQEKDVLRKGVVLPDAQRFDSNCITPGTSFMARLQAQLKYFVVSKISTDKTWRKVKVILSGHECPGEGEHKIMDYIRYLRSQLDYDSNTRHCLYGLDADLIMLGLCTHDPHFSLLREEVKFGRTKQSKKCLTPEETKFFLLHLSLLREYLEMEFDVLKNTLNFQFNLENIIDDWVLMGFLVGNDFIPHLPGLHINSGALPVLYKAYCEVLPTLDGYLNESGTLNLPRFEAYMKKLASFDIKQFREKYDDLRYLKDKTGGNLSKEMSNISESDVVFSRTLKPFFSTEEIQDFAEEDIDQLDETLDDEVQVQAVRDMMDLEEDEGSDYYDEDDTEKDRRSFFQEFILHKQNYYLEKLEFRKITQKVLREQAECYVKAIQWNLNYYYNGICSWSWYYPHHYAPYISDVQNFKDFKLDFELGEPFLPFEQLLAVLPSLSKTLLPEPFQELMTKKSSSIFNYYPCDFETDLNGKKNDWEAIVLIPFIDEKKLLKAMKSCYHRLTDEEKQRNKHGPMHAYTYTGEDLGRYEAPCYFNAVENHAVETPIYREEVIVPREKLRKGLLEGVLLDVYYPGFPTFKHLAYKSALEHRGVRIFQSSSQGLNMIVKIIKEEKEHDFEQLVSDLMNKAVYSWWPYLTESKVVSINDGKRKCVIEGNVMKTETLTEEQVKSFTSEVHTTRQEHLKTKGIDVGKTDVMLQIRSQEGVKFIFSPGNKIGLEKKWSNKLYSFPLQTIIKNLISNKSTVKNITIDDVFPVGSICFLLSKYYGCLGLVNDKSENGHVKLKVTVPPEPNEEDLTLEWSKIGYYSNNDAAIRASIPNYLLARITGTILVLDTDEVLDADKCSKVNIGLNLKFSRRNQLLPGYTKRNKNNTWFYSNKTISLIREYADSFPEVIRFLAENTEKDHFFKRDLFPLPGQAHMLNVITNWLDGKTELKGERKSCDAQLLEVDSIAELESKIELFMKNNKRGKYINLKSKPFHLYMPSSQIEKQPPDVAEFALLDRVVNVRDNFIVPLGFRGTIIGIENNEKSMADYDILFDQPFNAAVQYHTKKKRVYRMPENCLLNISYQTRKDAKEQKKISAQHKPQNAIQMIRNTPTRPSVTNRIRPLMAQPFEMPSIRSADIRGKVPSAGSSPYPYTGTALTKTVNWRNEPRIIQNSSSPVVNRNEPPQQYPTMERNVGVNVGSPPVVVNRDEPQQYEKNISVTVANDKPRQVRRNRSVDEGASPANKVEKSDATSTTCASVNGEELTETTKMLKKLLRISDENREDQPPPATSNKNEIIEDKAKEVANYKNENKGYVIELQELFQKAGKGNPRYDYSHCDGNFRATLHLPSIDIGITGDPATTKLMAGERAAFMVLHFLNLVRNFGDKVTPVSSNENTMLDLNLQFLRLQQQLQDTQRQQQMAPQQQLQQQQLQPYNVISPQDQKFQSLSLLRSTQAAQEQQKLQMILGAPLQPPQTQLPQTLMRQQPFVPQPQQMAAYQQPSMAQQRQLTMATNYIYQPPAMQAKYPIPPQQLYYQNVQNIFYNQSIRAPPPWFASMQQPNMLNITPANIPPRHFFADSTPSVVPQQVEKPMVVQNMNYFATSVSQPTHVPICDVVTGTTVHSIPNAGTDQLISRASQLESSVCSGRASKTPKKNRLAANFATKATT